MFIFLSFRCFNWSPDDAVSPDKRLHLKCNGDTGLWERDDGNEDPNDELNSVYLLANPDGSMVREVQCTPPVKKISVTIEDDVGVVLSCETTENFSGDNVFKLYLKLILLDR